MHICVKYENQGSFRGTDMPTKTCSLSLSTFRTCKNRISCFIVNYCYVLAPTTPSRLRGHRLGVSVPPPPNSTVQSSSLSSAKCSSDKGTWTPWLDQHDASKVEKFKSLFDAANLNLGNYVDLCLKLFLVKLVIFHQNRVCD